MWLYEDSFSDSCPLASPPFVHPTQISHINCILPWNIYPHFHDGEYEIALILQGEGQMMLPGSACDFSAGSITVTPPNMAHFFVFDPSKPVEYITLHLSPQGLERFLPPAGEIMQYLDSSYPQRYRRLVDNMLEIARENHGKIDARIQTLCSLISEEILAEPAECKKEILTSTPPYAKDLLLYLQRHIHEKLTLHDLAEQFYLSESHLSRIFLQTYHVSPINYLIYSKMRRARTYILQENLSPGEIAHRLAYKTKWQFCHAFKKFYGCLPEDYLAYAIQENRGSPI